MGDKLKGKVNSSRRQNRSLTELDYSPKVSSVAVSQRSVFSFRFYTALCRVEAGKFRYDKSTSTKHRLKSRPGEGSGKDQFPGTDFR